MQKKGDYIVSYAISKRIKRGWLVVILATSSISSAGDFYTNRKGVKCQPFFIFFFQKTLSLIDLHTNVCYNLL